MNDVVVTGLGAVTPVGASVSETWESVKKGESGASSISLFDPDEYEYDFRANAACEVDIDPTDRDVVDERSMGRHSQLGVIAAKEAMEDAGFGTDPSWNEPQNVGVSFASCVGGQLEIEENLRGIYDSGSIATRFSIQFLPNSTAGHNSILFDAQGPNRAPSTACAAGTHAICDAVDDIRLGRADVMIAGGSDAGVCSIVVGGFDVLRALTTKHDDPADAIRPFDEDRDGFLLGEGAGTLVLESAEHAEQRGAPIYATIEGVGLSGDADHPARPARDARGLKASVRSALDEAGREPDQIDHVNAHGTATPRGDEHEALCLDEVFDDVPPVTSVKSMMGHTLGASGAIEAVISTLAIRDDVLPPTANYETPDPDCDVPVVGETTSADVDSVVSNSAGFGGTNGTLVFGTHD